MLPLFHITQITLFYCKYDKFLTIKMSFVSFFEYNFSFYFPFVVLRFYVFIFFVIYAEGEQTKLMGYHFMTTERNIFMSYMMNT